MIDLQKLQQDFADDRTRTANLAKYLRMLADVYERSESVEAVAQHLSTELDGIGDPVVAKALTEHVRRSMYRLLLTIELDWRERKAGGSNGHQI